MPSQRKVKDSALCTLRSALCISAFTLIEMLTVIAIIGVLAAILIPVVQVAMRKARITTASADISHLSQAATAYSLDFGAFPPDNTAFWTSQNLVPGQDSPFPGNGNSQIGVPNLPPLNPNELLMWYLTMQYSTGQYNVSTVPPSYPATGYPDGYLGNGSNPNAQWPSSASIVFSRGVNAGPYFDWKSKQKTDYNQNGFYEFVDPWGRPYMYRAYPQAAQVTNWTLVQLPNNGPWVVTLTLNNLTAPNNYIYTYTLNSVNYNVNYPAFDTDTNLANLTAAGKSLGNIQLSGFTNSTYNGTFAFSGSASNEVNITFTTNPGATNNFNVNGSAIYGYCTFPLHNKQSCDIYSLGPHGLTRAASMPLNGSPTITSEWKPTHGGTTITALATTPWLDPTSLDAWIQVWGTSGDGNDINSTSGNVVTNTLYQDNIANWN